MRARRPSGQVAGLFLPAALVSLLLLMLVLASSASANVTKTINFNSPELQSDESPAITNQYAAEGLEFIPVSKSSNTTPLGSGYDTEYGLEWEQFAQPYLTLDPAHAHTGNQVVTAYEHEGIDGPGECIRAWSDIAAHLTSGPTGRVEAYVGAESNSFDNKAGGEIYFDGYSSAGELVAFDKVTAGATDSTLMKLESNKEDISYFDVVAPEEQNCDKTPVLELDDVSFSLPSPLPASIHLEAASQGAGGYQGGTATLPIRVFRENGAEEPIELHVSGLPAGVSVTGGTTIAKGQTSTKLTFSISNQSALVNEVPITITATSNGLGTQPAPVKSGFSISRAVTIVLDQNGDGLGGVSETGITLGPCSSGAVTITDLQEATGSSMLTVSGTGDTTGLSAKLSTGTISRGGTATLSFASEGSGGAGNATYTVTATDGSLPSTSVTVTVERDAATTTQGIYVTQGTQPDFGRLEPSGNGASGRNYVGVKLVAGKTTIVRVYGDASGSPPGQPGAVALLYGYAHGKPLPGSPLSPEYGPGTLADIHAAGEVVSDAELESEAAAGSTGNAYTFTLPESWTTAGLVIHPSASTGTYYPSGQTIQLVANTLPYAGSGQGPSCHSTSTASFTLNNVLFNEVGFNYDAYVNPYAMTSAARPGVKYPKGVETGEPPPPAEVFQDAEAVTPVPNGYFLGSLEYVGETDISGIAASGANGNEKNEEVLEQLEEVADGRISHVVGINLGVARGLTSGDSSVAEGKIGWRPLTSVAHEIFHQYGLAHASKECGGGTGGQSGSPWPQAQGENRATVEHQIEEYWGKNENFQELSNEEGFGQLLGIAVNTTSEPYKFIGEGLGGYPHAFDLMSYCGQVGGGDPNDWVSPINWEKLVQTFGITSGASAASAKEAAQASLSAATRRPLIPNPLAATANVEHSELKVVGYAEGEHVQIRSVGSDVGHEPQSAPAGSPYTLLALGHGGKLIASVPMDLKTIADSGELTRLVAYVPSAGVESLSIDRGGAAVATRTRPARAPRLKVLEPRAGSRVGGKGKVLVAWRSSNPEHLKLKASIDYSTNAGKTWRTIFIGPDRGRATLRSSFFTASRNARVRVRLNDGFNEALATSGKFTARGAPPTIAILTRFAKGEIVAGDASVQLDGAAFDQSLRTLSGHELRWYDGSVLLGYGSDISAGALPPGVNRIRLLARDSDGRSASATVTVPVAAVSIPNLSLTLPRRSRPTARKLTFSAADAAGATITVLGHEFKLTPKLARYTVPVPRGRGSLLVEISVTTEGVTTRFASTVVR
jgi:hypothetical protein